MSEENQWEDVSGDGGVLKRMIQAASSDGADSSLPEDGEEVNINYTGCYYS